MTLDAEQMHAQNPQVLDEFRRNGGHVGGNFEGPPVLLLHHVGAKSGAKRINPMMYQQVGDAYAVFASAAGDDDHPASYHNLMAHPDVTAEFGTTTLELHARVPDDAEREPIWERQKSDSPGFAGYEAKTDRTNPGRPTHEAAPTATNSGATAAALRVVDLDAGAHAARPCPTSSSTVAIVDYLPPGSSATPSRRW